MILFQLKSNDITRLPLWVVCPGFVLPTTFQCFKYFFLYFYGIVFFNYLSKSLKTIAFLHSFKQLHLGVLGSFQ